MHLIGLKLKEMTGVKWLADFRDPWTDIDFYDQLKLTRWADNRHHYLEKKVLQKADLVISVSESNKLQLLKKSDANINVITNGFDESDFSDTSSKLDKKFTIAHIGTFMANRNPDVLWEVLSELISENNDFKVDFELHLIGKTDAHILDLIHKKGLSDCLRSTGSVTHKEAIQFQKNAQVLLITVNKTGDSKGMVTGKVFEYLVSGRPILAIGPEDGDLAYILKDTRTGVISDFENKIDLKKNIQTFYREYKNKTLQINPRNLDTYSRKNLTKKMAESLSTLL
jgi:glycosyltransferase involved in cell wall biosynthesis